MIEVHEEPEEVQKEFGSLMEKCEFCQKPTRFWTMDGQNAVCPCCAKKHTVRELSKW